MPRVQFCMYRHSVASSFPTHAQTIPCPTAHLSQHYLLLKAGFSLRAHTYTWNLLQPFLFPKFLFRKMSLLSSCSLPIGQTILILSKKLLCNTFMSRKKEKQFKSESLPSSSETLNRCPFQNSHFYLHLLSYIPLLKYFSPTYQILGWVSSVLFASHIILHCKQQFLCFTLCL